MTAFDWALAIGALVITAECLVLFAADWRARRRPVRDCQGRWLAPRLRHDGWGEWEW